LAAQDDEPKVPWLASVIPEVYYDFIRRVVPGVLLLLPLSLCILFRTLSREEFFRWSSQFSVGSATLVLILFLGMAYILGMTLDLFGAALYFVLLALVWKLWLKMTGFGEKVAPYCQQLGFGDVHALSPTRIASFAVSIHDNLKANNDQARPILCKMQAEAGFCYNVAIVFIALLTVVRFLGLDCWGLSKKSLLTFGLLPFVIMCLNGVYRTLNLWNRQVSFLEFSSKTGKEESSG
jgi:hypothetical protein